MNESLYYDLKQDSGMPPSMSSHVAGEIGRKIVSGNYRPNDLIEDESSLENRYRVSKSVIREAIKILVGKGLLEVRRGIGTRVRPRDKWGLLDDDVLAWCLSAPLNSEVLVSLMETRQIFEPKAARWAAERATEPSLDNIKAAVENMENKAGKGTPIDFVMADAAFHQAVLRSTKNEFLVAMEGVIFSALLSSIRLTNSSSLDNEDSVPLHREVYEAIAARNADLAETRMSSLLDHAGVRLKDKLALLD